MTTTRATTLASLSKVARGAATSLSACVNFVKELGNQEDTKYTFIDAYASGSLDLKPSQVATLRLRASPDAKVPNTHGQRTFGEHKAIRAAEVAWIKVRDLAGFKPAKRDGRANNAVRPAPSEPVTNAPITLHSVLLPTVTDANDALAWLNELATKARTFRNKNAKLFDTLGDDGMHIRDALASLAKAIDGAKAAIAKPTTGFLDLRGTAKAAKLAAQAAEIAQAIAA